MAAPSSDIISLLPDCLLEVILVRLPLQEIVRTSVLSKRWILLWTQIWKLVFDKFFCRRSLIKDKERLFPIIADIVLRSRKPIIGFSFSLNGLPSFEIDQLVNYVCNNGVKFFKLEIPNHEIYQLRSFDQLHSVKQLTLGSCLIKVPCEFRGFTMLTYIYFYNVEIDGGDLSDLVSTCPLLETLYLKNLQCCGYLVLVAPSLRVFSCEGFFLSFCLKSTPRLEEMTVSVYDEYDEYDEVVDSGGSVDMVVPFGNISAIKYLALDGRFLMYMNVGIQKQISRCRSVLNHLKVIKLTDVPFELIEVSQNVLSLIRCSPTLGMIIITTCTKRLAFDPAVKFWQTENLSDVSLIGLRQACVLNITGKQSELLFIKILLAKSPMLETMVFRLHDRLTREEGLRISEEIRGFGCASSQVEIVYLNPLRLVCFQENLI